MCMISKEEYRLHNANRCCGCKDCKEYDELMENMKWIAQRFVIVDYTK